MKRIIIGAFVIAILVLLLLAIFWFITPELQVLVTDRIHTADHVLTSSDKLDFAGVMLGSIITIIALCVTIIFTQEQQRETLRLSKLPYIVSDMLVLQNLDSVEKACFALPHRYYFLTPCLGYCVVNNYYNATLNYNLLEEIRKNGSDFFSHHLIIDYQVTNSGAGNAVNYKLVMNTIELSKTSDALAVNRDANYIIVIHESFLEQCDDNVFSRLRLEFKISYMDESNVGCYYQTETINAEKNNELNELYTVQEVSESLSQAKRLISRQQRNKFLNN